MDSMRGKYDTLGKKMEREKKAYETRWLKSVAASLKPQLPEFQAIKLLAQHLELKDDGRGVTDLMDDWIKRRCDPKLKTGVVNLAGASNGILFEERYQSLLRMAVVKALDDRDDGFFIKLGAAFARARKARKADPGRASEVRAKHSQSQMTLDIGEFLLDWWLTKDGLGPQLCLFTDLALGDLLEVVFVGMESKDWQSYASKARQRMRLRSAPRKIVTAVRLEELGTASRKFIRQDKTDFNCSRYVLVTAN